MSLRWDGSDPTVRALRVIGFVAIMLLVTVLVVALLIDPSREDAYFPIILLLVGAVLLMLAFPVVLPGLMDRRSGDAPPPERERRKS